MTAQAPYESLTPDEAAQRLRLIGNECRARCKSKGVDCGTCARSDAAIEMAIAALPERAPVSAVAFEMSYPKTMDAVSFIAAPEFVRTLERAEYIAENCLRLYGEAATYRPVVYATPPPPAVSDAVRALPGKWRRYAVEDEGGGGDGYCAGKASARRAAADELEAALSASPAGQERGQAIAPDLAALARRCLWLAFCWNDHNFDAAHKEARREAEAQGIKTMDDANEWLDRLAAAAAERDEP